MIILLKTIFNFILIKVQDAVGTVKQHIAVTNEGDVSLFLIDVVWGCGKVVSTMQSVFENLP